MNAKIDFNDKEFKRFIQATDIKRVPIMVETVKKTTQFALRLTKETLPKRTGNLRGSYFQKKIDKLEREVNSKSQYAEGIEVGFKSKTIRPKRAKILTIPIKKSVLTPTGAQIRQGALNRLFNRLKNPGGKTQRQIFDQVGIVLAKKARIPAIKGQKNFKLIILPKTQKKLELNLFKSVKRLGFVFNG